MDEIGGWAGVEWYFGANFPSDDLSSEDWRPLANRWEQALDEELFALYVPEDGSAFLTLLEGPESYRVRWYDPLRGGPLQPTGEDSLPAGGNALVGQAPTQRARDWVLLLDAEPAADDGAN